MSKQTLAALCALLVAASTLAVVASPAAAHDIYHYENQKQKQQRCAFDPFAGNQCWTVTVTVRVKVPSHHSHAQVCPAGTTGTYPDCWPVPPTTTDPTPDNDWTDPKDGGDGTGGDGSGGDDGSRGDGTGGDGSGGDDGSRGDGTGGDGSGGDGTGGNIGTTYTVQPCTPHQDPLETYQRHKHPLGDGTDTGCHRHDNSHCPAGHTEQGGHGSGDCRKNDNPDTIFTRIQHLLEQGGKAALEAIIETLKNEAADQLDNLDIDWEDFATDGDEQQKLLDVLNPVLEQNNVEIYTIDDIENLWADIGTYGRRAAQGGAGALACYAAVEAVMAKLTKGKSLKKEARRAVEATATAVCGIGTASVPVPDGDGDGDGGDGGDSADPPAPPTIEELEKRVKDLTEQWQNATPEEQAEAKRQKEKAELERDCAKGEAWMTFPGVPCP